MTPSQKRLGPAVARQVRDDAPAAEPWVLRHVRVVVIVGAAGALGMFIVWYWAAGGEVRNRFDVGIAAATATAAVVAGALAWGRLELSREQHRLSVDRNLTERYSHCIEQIGSADKFVRIGGIYGLERFALDAARAGSSRNIDWGMALEVLATLAREISHQARNAAASSGDDPGAPRAVVEAVRVLGRFPGRSGRHVHEELVESGSGGGHDLTGVIARAANLSDADFIGARLSDADFIGARLSDADFARANLTDADLTRADLSGATLTDARLVYVKLARANLTGADLTRADLRMADLTGADLTDAQLRGVVYDDTTRWPNDRDYRHRSR